MRDSTPHGILMLHRFGASMDQQLPLPYIPRAIAGSIVSQRHKDGFINATAMCRAAGRAWADYNRLGATKAFLEALAADMGIPISKLIQQVAGGTPQLQGTWVHPQIAIHLAQWCSPAFAVQVSRWVFEWMSGAAKAPMPYHLRRYAMNQRNVPRGHFSVLNEIAATLIAPMELAGYTLPEKLWPDISQGMMFARYVREQHGVNTDSLPSYTHEFEDGRPSVLAKAYPNEWLGEFRNHFERVWIPLRSRDYFQQRDNKALPYLAHFLPISDKAD
jgi:hypothetical protein